MIIKELNILVLYIIKKENIKVIVKKIKKKEIIKMDNKENKRNNEKYNKDDNKDDNKTYDNENLKLIKKLIIKRIK